MQKQEHHLLVIWSCLRGQYEGTVLCLHRLQSFCYGTEAFQHDVDAAVHHSAMCKKHPLINQSQISKGTTLLGNQSHFVSTPNVRPAP